LILAQQRSLNLALLFWASHRAAGEATTAAARQQAPRINCHKEFLPSCDL